MRLLSRSNNKLEFTADKTPTGPYAILSHTWSTDPNDEVTYDDIVQNRNITKKPGFVKLDFCLTQASKAGLKYVWIDSCCIDRSNRVELGRSINQMFKWYAKAQICYVFLSDVARDASGEWQSQFHKSRWFTRGWTLQELLVPRSVEFYSARGNIIGDLKWLKNDIEVACGIRIRPLEQISYQDRFEWSLKRQTTEPEDMSYALLGLMDVSLMENYGEGANAARERLFDEVEKQHGKRTSNALRIAAHIPKTGSISIDEPEAASNTFLTGRLGTSSTLNQQSPPGELGDWISCFDQNVRSLAIHYRKPIANLEGADLVKHGYRPDGTNEHGRTALFYCRDYQSMHLLVSVGSKLNAVDSSGQTPIHFVIDGREEAAVVVDAVNRYQSYNIKFDSGDHRGTTPLMLACFYGRIEIARMLLKWGALVNRSNESGMTALMMACQSWCHDIVTLLLDHGAGRLIDHHEKYGFTALCWALAVVPEDARVVNKIVKALLDAGADPNSRPTAVSRLAPLHLACKHKLVSTVKILLNAGANVNIRGSDGSTALVIAWLHKRVDLVTTLLEAGADMDVLSAAKPKR